MIGDLEYRKESVRLTEQRIKKVVKLEAQTEKLYNEIFSPELWRAKESVSMARIQLEAVLRKQKELLSELTKNP